MYTTKHRVFYWGVTVCRRLGHCQSNMWAVLIRNLPKIVNINQCNCQSTYVYDTNYFWETRTCLYSFIDKKTYFQVS